MRFSLRIRFILLQKCMLIGNSKWEVAFQIIPALLQQLLFSNQNGEGIFKDKSNYVSKLTMRWLFFKKLRNSRINLSTRQTWKIIPYWKISLFSMKFTVLLVTMSYPFRSWESKTLSELKVMQSVFFYLTVFQFEIWIVQL